MCAHELARIVLLNTGIVQLVVKKNHLKDQGIAKLMKAAGKANHLVRLNLQSNSLTPLGMEILFRSLIKNVSIISLSVGSIEGV